MISNLLESMKTAPKPSNTTKIYKGKNKEETILNLQTNKVSKANWSPKNSYFKLKRKTKESLAFNLQNPKETVQI